MVHGPTNEVTWFSVCTPTSAAHYLSDFIIGYLFHPRYTYTEDTPLCNVMLPCFRLTANNDKLTHKKLSYCRGTIWYFKSWNFVNCCTKKWKKHIWKRLAI